MTALSMFVDAPILGHGPHTFGLFYLDYLHRLEIPAWISVDPRPLSWAHNVYLQVLAEQGIVGALALVPKQAQYARVIGQRNPKSPIYKGCRHDVQSCPPATQRRLFG